MRPFRFGLLIERFSNPADVHETAQRAEAAGFSILLIRDHLIDSPFGPQYAPWTTLAAVAQATTRLRVGTLVVANDFRHPAVLAKEATTLDQLSGGRVELGLGAGFLREEYARAGLTFDENRVRVDRFEESLDLLNRLLRGEVVTHTGEHYRLESFVNFPEPVQRPRPRLLVGGSGPRMLALAARHADTVALLPSSLHRGVLVDSPAARSRANVLRQVAHLRECAGPRFNALELSLTATVVSSGDPISAARQIAAQRGWNVSPDEVLEMPSIIVGETAAMVEHLARVREQTGVSYFVVRDGQFEAARALVQRLTQ